MRDEHLEAQRRFYDAGDHAHLRPQEGDFYAEKLAHGLGRYTALEPHHRVLEVGAGFGRFTFDLLDQCQSVVALDLSERLLASLATTRDERGIAADRCPTLVSDVDEIEHTGGSFDRIVGFFFLHHLPDFPATVRRLAEHLAPGGRMAFLEPNRRNPLFLAQVACCPDMPWRDEKGMFTLSAKKVENAYRAAGLHVQSTERMGFFPPQVLNRIPLSRSLEAKLESWPWLRGGLPFLLLGAEKR